MSKFQIKFFIINNPILFDFFVNKYILKHPSPTVQTSVTAVLTVPVELKLVPGLVTTVLGVMTDVQLTRK